MDSIGRARRVLSIEISELQRLSDRLDGSFPEALRLLRVLVWGLAHLLDYGLEFPLLKVLHLD